MATSITPSGSLSFTALLQHAFSGDDSGFREARLSYSKRLSDTAALPGTLDFTYYLCGKSVVCAAGDWLLCNADPFGSMDDAQHPDGYSANTRKLVALIVHNTDEANDITIKRGATNGLPIFDTAGAGQKIKPGGIYIWIDPTGTEITLSSGVNDKITVSVSAGSPVAEVYAVFL